MKEGITTKVNVLILLPEAHFAKSLWRRIHSNILLWMQCRKNFAKRASHKDKGIQTCKTTADCQVKSRLSLYDLSRTVMPICVPPSFIPHEHWQKKAASKGGGFIMLPGWEGWRTDACDCARSTLSHQTWVSVMKGGGRKQKSIKYSKLCKYWMEDLKDPLFLYFGRSEKGFSTFTYGVDTIVGEWIFFEVFIQSFFHWD